jgi:hypothetical protein
MSTWLLCCGVLWRAHVCAWLLGVAYPNYTVWCRRCQVALYTCDGSSSQRFSYDDGTLHWEGKNVWAGFVSSSILHHQLHSTAPAGEMPSCFAVLVRRQTYLELYNVLQHKAAARAWAVQTVSCHGCLPCAGTTKCLGTFNNDATDGAQIKVSRPVKVLRLLVGGLVLSLPYMALYRAWAHPLLVERLARQTTAMHGSYGFLVSQIKAAWSASRSL